MSAKDDHSDVKKEGVVLPFFKTSIIAVLALMLIYAPAQATETVTEKENTVEERLIVHHQLVREDAAISVTSSAEAYNHTSSCSLLSPLFQIQKEEVRLFILYQSLKFCD